MGKEDFIKNVNKHFGKKKGLITEDPKNLEVEKFPTGSYKLDEKLKGGYAKGTITALLGEQQAGKTTSCIEAARQHQIKYPNEHVLWLDLERAFDAEYFESIGVDLDYEKFTHAKPDTGEEAYQIMLDFIESFNGGGMVVVDSVDSLLPETEEQSDMGDANIGAAAKLNSQGIRKLVPRINKKNVTLFFINQIRANIGNSFKPFKSSGGYALEHYPRTRLHMFPKKGEEVISTGVTIKTEKANYGKPNEKFSTNIIYGKGFDREAELIELAAERGVVEKKSSWYYYEGTIIAQGIPQFKTVLQDNPEFKEELLNKIQDQQQ